MATLTGKTISQLNTLETITPNSLFIVEYSGMTYNIPYSGINYTYITTTYYNLINSITGGTLTAGSYYLITDFQTCYDQPDFDYYQNAITSVTTYHTSAIEPILVLATSSNTLSPDAYQPLYPNDKIKYDWTWNQTEVTLNPAKGRITERIDEFNNRTDYDHRTILFKRYRLYTTRPGQPLNGTIELQNDGTVLGTNTYFTGLSVGDVIHMDGNNLFYEITSISDDTTMTVSGDSIVSFGCCSDFYKAIEETNNTNGYFSIKRMNVKSNDFEEYTTFGNALAISYAKNNYVGNYTTYLFFGPFLLANNVFLEGEYESNKFGDYCYNNTFGTDNQNNIWADYCYENVSTNDIDNNIIGYGFSRNIINVNLTNNQIGNGFRLNSLFAENNEDFENNIIGNNFNNNIVYSWFYENEILDNFNNNFIGSFGNLTQFVFNRNYIKNNFNNNTIKQNFEANQISPNFQENVIYGFFNENTISTGFINNKTSYYFTANNIGNSFNGNTIGDNFYKNTVKSSFIGNTTSHDFKYNEIGDEFINNNLQNSNLFGWNDLTTVSARTYTNWRNSLDGNVGNVILGKELVMRVISASRYFKIKFLQWTQGGIGGAFQYERQEIDSLGNDIDPAIIFTKTNNGNEIDVIIPGVVEITRGSQYGIYNVILDPPPSSGAWPGPSDTEWNSIYNVSNNGKYFSNNKIGTNFSSKIIGSYFGYNGSPQGNIINDDFTSNTIGSYMNNNVIGNYFQNNIIGDDFRFNEIKIPLNSIDFTSATHVYGNYNCTLFSNSTSTLRLSYYNSSDVLNITNITD